MSAARAKIAYLEHRLELTMSLRDKASGPCARTAHAKLVELYKYRLAALRTYGMDGPPIDALIEQAREAAEKDRAFSHPFQWQNVSEIDHIVARQTREAAFA